MEDFGSDSLAKIQVAGRWDLSGANSVTAAIGAGAGPFGESAYELSGIPNSGNAYLQKTVIGNGTQMTTAYMCVWFKCSGFPVVNQELMSIWDGATEQTSIGLTSTGQFQVFRGSVRTGTQIGGSSTAIPVGQWGWLVFKVVLGTGTSGSMEVLWNNVAILGPTGSLNTANSGVAQANGCVVGFTSGPTANNLGITLFYSDFILLDQQGSVNNSIPTQSRVYFFLPTSNGSFAQFTPLANANWQEVSNNPDTGDSSYNSSSTVSQKDSFNHAAVASNVTTVLGVQTQFTARIDDAGPHTTQCVLYDGTTEVDAPAAVALSPTYQWVEAVQETNLTSGLAFTTSDINNLQFGYKLTT